MELQGVYVYLLHHWDQKSLVPRFLLCQEHVEVYLLVKQVSFVQLHYKMFDQEQHRKVNDRIVSKRELPNHKQH